MAACKARVSFGVESLAMAAAKAPSTAAKRPLRPVPLSAEMGTNSAKSRKASFLSRSDFTSFFFSASMASHLFTATARARPASRM